MANPLRNIGGTAGDLNRVIGDLVNAFGPEEAARVARSPNFGQMLQAAAPAVKTAGFGIGGAVAAELLAQPISRGLESLLGRSVAPSMAPSQYQEASGRGSSKYFFQPETYTNYAQWYANEVYKIRLYNSTVGKVTGQLLQEPPSPEEFARQSVERSEYQAQTFNQRLIEQERAKAEAEYRIRAMEAGYGLEAEKVKTLGDVQRQRIASGYSTAASTLNSAIENIYARAKLENSPVLTEISKAF